MMQIAFNSSFVLLHFVLIFKLVVTACSSFPQILLLVEDNGTSVLSLFFFLSGTFMAAFAVWLDVCQCLEKIWWIQKSQAMLDEVWVFVMSEVNMKLPNFSIQFGVKTFLPTKREKQCELVLHKAQLLDGWWCLQVFVLIFSFFFSFHVQTSCFHVVTALSSKSYWSYFKLHICS